MTKIFFIGDTHFGKIYPYLKDYVLNISKRNLDIINNCEIIIKSAIEEEADYVIFLGDVYDRKTISPTIRRILREKIFIPLYKNDIQVIIIGGNHDSVRHPERGVDLLELSNFPNVNVITNFKPIISNNNTFGFLFLPFIHYDVLVDMARKIGIEIPQDQNNYLIAQKIIKTYIKQIHDLQLKDCNKKLLIGHYFLEGAKIRETNNPDLIYGEFKFNKEMVQKDLFDLVIFGHVHLRQKLWNDDRIIIPGSIDRIDIGERDSNKYYCVYDIENDDLEFREINCRNLLKIDVAIPYNSENYTGFILERIPEKSTIENAICKVKIEFPKGTKINIDKNKIKLHFSNAFYSNIQYIEKQTEGLEHLRELNLEPISLFRDFIEQKYSDYKYYEEMKKVGIEFLEKEFKTVDLTTSGPISIKSIDLQNFNKYGKGPNTIDFGLKSYVIKGPTGSGKSSILDAVTFALFKKSSRREAGLVLDQILYKGGYVNLELMIGNSVLQVKRSTKSPKFSIKLEDKPIFQALTIPEKEIKLQDIIGYDYESFTSSFFIRQQELQIFSNLTSGQRQERLVKLFKLKAFTNASVKLKKRVKDLDNKLISIESEINAFLIAIKELPELKKELVGFKEELEELISNEKGVNEKIKVIEIMQKKLEPSYIKYVETTELLKNLNESKDKTAQELENTKVKQKEFSTLEEKLEKFRILKQKRVELEDQKEILEKKSIEKERIENKITKNIELKSKIQAQFVKRLKEVFNQITKNTKRIKLINVDLTKEKAFNILIDNGKFSERLDRLQHVEIPLAKEYKDNKRIKEFSQLQEKTVKELEVNTPQRKLITKDVFIADELILEKKRLEEKQISIDKEAQKNTTEFENQIKEFNDQILKEDLAEDYSILLLEVKNQFRSLKEKEDIKDNIEKQLRETQDFSTLIEKYEKDSVKIDEELEVKTKELKSYELEFQKYNENTIKNGELLNNLTTIEKNIEIKIVQINTTEKDIKRKKEIEQKIKDDEKKLRKLKFEIEIFSMLIKNVFHLNGVPKFAIEKILPEIAIRASQILSDLTDGKLNTVEFKPVTRKNQIGFDIYVFDGEQERIADTFSGGEKTQINASIRFAIIERIAEIPDTTGAIFRKSNTLFIDEGDLGTLDDESSRQKFVDKILELNNMFKNIILITHLEDVAQQFPNKILIGQDNLGKSKILSQS